ncbi:MAG: NAD(P)/FAD-dependent oxidoreductase [Intestinimonas sp.]|jgi:predicted Rossmann fold flavoprotein|nr:NAD(P)/FAD-dependent oxidoreductase [Intestinimonas sp.]
MLAALTASQAGADVLLLEQNQKLGRKLYITGKGRCNLTNDCSAAEVLANVPHNSRFLMSCMAGFPPEEVKKAFQKLGVPLKTERGNRVFPQSDRAADVIDAMLSALRRSRVVLMQDRAKHIRTANGAVCGVQTAHGELSCKAIILATGGVSYPLTGSTGDGYRMAAELGHTVIPPKPSLVPLEAEDDFCRRMQGLSLRNVSIKVKNRKKKILFQEQGELLFTHFGLSGPLILSASVHMREYESDHYTIMIDLKPALDEQMLDARLLREFSANPNRSIHHVLSTLLPRLMVPIMEERACISGTVQANAITKLQRRRLLELLKCFPIEVAGPRPVEEAIVTAGGVKVSEVVPATMQSKRVEGLFFAGELLDVDAYTGGFNLQIAWSTGHAAGEAASRYVGKASGVPC